ncbi:DNA polymerase III subunit alpha [Blochmannia endosymbiont of Camponotus (Colobopsis) obliquus]|uniref:DNA polymerase III subunit alpha n=1 Tax=Blochmannia endosymbiont of Camponotus (Colobopsis) obliquus TaxID=1505597 RepID=UPI00061A64F6|nr:DNA polymerase III subunit alpha [Blochmannia endosymbiont of Camponotus (Colobopsis) obliquus]AKC60452.1 DNA polymerase III subunit alpha [Blochmannia endosymbiont of Camponotus (Colobopsis) obliquus]
MPEPKFIHLHVHSDYSMIDGICKVDELLKQASYFKMPALALTDFSNLFGLIKFYNLSCNFGIKPIIGVDFLFSSNMFNETTCELTFLVINNIGYRNLKLLISKSYRCGYTDLGPVINRNWLIDYNEGLIIISGCKGDVGKYLVNDNILGVNRSLSFYERYFSNRYYLEVLRTGRYNEEIYLNAVVELAKRKGLPIVATNDVRFLKKADFDIHEIRVAINQGRTIDDNNRSRIYSVEQFMKSEQEMCELFSDLPESLVNSVEIARRCNVIIEFDKFFLPQFSTGSVSAKKFLIMHAQKGLENRLISLFPNSEERLLKRPIYDARLNTELKIINQMGFPGYFLIVMEFITWAKNNDIPVGPGRGSGAGSLVAYVLKITDIDPLLFDLLFERFLNPERISMPDLDIDFCMEKRDQVIDHVIEIYGKYSVSQIITFGTMSAKVVIRDVGRVLGYPYAFVDRISKLIPVEIGITLDKALCIEIQLRELYENNDEVKTLIDTACKLEGIVRNVGKHAGGIVISPTDITNFSPLYYDSDSKYPMTHFDKDDIERIGLVKFDFLGLRTLSIIDWTLKMVNKKQIKRGLPLVNISSISLKDKKSFSLLQSTETRAVFQLESWGMKKLIKRLKPDRFEDIIALVALFRPGPLQSGMVDNFIARKHGHEIISYPDIQCQHELLRPVLESTYGVILYQEQVMKIAQVLAGYTLGSADLLRRAMGKKNMEEMIKQRDIFKHGANVLGINSKLSMRIFDLVEKFAGYGFNKSHSAAYALISYETLWLKAHYPAEYMASVLNADIDNIEKVVEMIDECYRMKLRILPPNINISEYRFYVNDKQEIVYGMGAIKGIGEGSAESIVKARSKYGNFHKLLDVCLYTDFKKLNRRVLEKLILSGSCDCFEVDRSKLIESINNTIKFANQYINSKNSGQQDMFKVLEDKCSNKLSGSDRYVSSKQVILEGEKKALGFYLTEHPVLQYLEEIKYYDDNILHIADISSLYCGKIISIFGLIISSRVIITKSGHRLCICVLDDHSGRVDVLFFSNMLKKYQNYLQKDQIVYIQGLLKIYDVNSSFKIIAYKLVDIDEARKNYVRRLIIYLNEKQINDHFLHGLKLSLKPYLGGIIPIYIFYQKQGICTYLRLGSFWKVFITNELLNNLYSLIGGQQIKLEFYSKRR